MKRESPLGDLIFEQGLRLGSHRDEGIRSDVELLVTGDESPPSATKIAAIQSFLLPFARNVLELRRKLPLSWSYYPIRIALTVDGRLSVEFRFKLPF